MKFLISVSGCGNFFGNRALANAARTCSFGEMASDKSTQMQPPDLSPLNWSDVLAQAESRLGKDQRIRFERLHRNFVSYPTEHTLKSFYAFIYTHQLHALLTRFRGKRIQAIWCALAPLLQPGLRVLDLGAGAGALTTLIQSHITPSRSYPPALWVYDICPQALTHLQSQGFAALPDPGSLPETFTGSIDVIVCADSLGETHADDDLPPIPGASIEIAQLGRDVEARYGFAAKLAPWRKILAPQGRVLLWEPLRHEVWFAATAWALEQSGWNASVVLHASAPYVQLSQTLD